MIKSLLYSLLLISLLSTFACNDPVAIDTDIVDIDLIDVQVMDDFDMSSFTTLEDSLISFNPTFFLLDQYPFGIDEDPVFGTVTNAISTQFLLIQAPPDFSNAIVDSVILEANISQNFPFYGDSTQAIGIEVVEINEVLDFNTTYQTNQVTELDDVVIGTFNGVPNYREPQPVGRFVLDSLILDTFPPQIRIPLVNNFGQRILFSPPGTLDNNVAFLEAFRGLHLRPTNTNNGLIGLDFNTFDTASDQGISGVSIQIFFTQNGVRNQYQLEVSSILSVKLSEQSHDFTGAPVEEFFESELLGDSLIFVQGMSGPNGVVRINDADRLQGSIINGATLEVFGTALNGEEDLRPVTGQLVLFDEDEDGELGLTRDFLAALSAGSISVGGGTPEVEDMGNGIFKYTFNVGAQLQDIVEEVRPNEIIIRADAKVANMRRVVLFGAGHSEFPMKLNVTFTKL